MIRIGYRLLLSAAASANLVIMIASHDIPLGLYWEVLLVFVPWVLLAVGVVTLMIKARRTKTRGSSPRRSLPLPPLRGHLVLYAFFATVIGILGSAVAASSLGNLDMGCHGGPATCININQYSEKDGAYYRKYPYDAAGASDPNAPWTPISRAEYIGEVGTKLRSAGMFGALVLLGATYLSLGEEGMRLRPASGGVLA